MTGEEIRFGFLGPGKIAHRFASAFEHTTGAQVYAVASRDYEKAREFAAVYCAEKTYGDYESIVNDQR
jgi:predicted dehydrogenase